MQEIPADPGPEAGDDFMLERTFISTPKVANLDCGISTDCVFADALRDQVLTILLDRILTPRNAPDIEFNNYFMKVAWSTTPIDSAKPFYKPKCLIGTLTSHWEMRIYDQKQRIGIVDEEMLPNARDDEEADMFHDDWAPMVDLNQAYQELIMPKWASEKVSVGEEVFNVYKARMYSLAIVDFSWLEPWAVGGVTQNPLLATFHGDGQMVIWELARETDGNFRAKAIFMKSFRKNDMVKCHRFFRLSETEGVIVIGYQSGLVKLYRIVTVPAGNMKTEEGAEKPPLFKIESDEELWENDELPVEFIEHVSTESSKDGACLTLVVIKHPHFVINFKIDVVRGKVTWEELNYLECPDGIIVGISRYSKDVFFLGLDCGKLGMLELQDTTAYYSLIEQGFVDEAPPNVAVTEEEDQHAECQDEFESEDLLDHNRIHSDDPAYLDLWMYTGFALSPNGIIGCFCKTLMKTPDTSVIKDFSACTFASLFPDENHWNHVILAYRQNDHNIPKIMDVLQAFKFHVREHNDYEIRRYKPEADNAELWELKLYLWILKAIGIPTELPTNKPWLPLVGKSDIKTMILKEMALVEETILELFYSNLMLRLLASPDDRLNPAIASPLELCSAAAMLTYLRSKPGVAEIKSTLENLQVTRPTELPCSCCDSPISFSNDLSYQNGITWPGIPGHKWTGQTCDEQHPNVVCILSLVPLKFPHRECPWCGCGALIEPVFNQAPICPFCDEFMLFNREIQDTFQDDLTEEN